MPQDSSPSDKLVLDYVDSPLRPGREPARRDLHIWVSGLAVIGILVSFTTYHAWLAVNFANLPGDPPPYVIWVMGELLFLLIPICSLLCRSLSCTALMTMGTGLFLLAQIHAATTAGQLDLDTGSMILGAAIIFAGYARWYYRLI